jgi:uncharacterized protein
MALLFNLRHLEEKNLRLKGQISAEELEVETLDEVIHAREPLTYDLEIQQIEEGVLVQGTLAITLDCECVRCLKPHRHPLKFEGWVCHLPLVGEDRVAVVNDCVDLTPQIREDIVLAFPQHPLCKPDCGGLPGSQLQPEKGPGAADKPAPDPSAWAALDRLKL